MKIIFKNIIHHHHHHHSTQCIPLIEELWTGSGERKTAATHTHKGECGQKESLDSRKIQKIGDVATRENKKVYK